MSTEPESLILHMLREMRSEIGDLRSDMATGFAELRSELKSDMHSLRADVASDIMTIQAELKSTRKDLGDQVGGLRRAVVEYHTSVIGHGILISEFEAACGAASNI